MLKKVQREGSKQTLASTDSSLNLVNYETELFAFIIIVPLLCNNNNNTSKANSSLFLINSLALFEMALRRIKKELAELKQELITGCTAAPMNDGKDMFHWKATIKGPPDSAHERGTFIYGKGRNTHLFYREFSSLG
ncbi:hypothetical protein niasHS_014340 [Heterodera schachtii]|uniref:UBC core domain-containing protein n=1 Tax=Heterodera schachtii TaxID=97005 RepID=A0ABD2ICD6_HETSC